MKAAITTIILLVLPIFSFSQQPNAPLKKNDFKKVTSYSELTTFVHELDAQSNLLTVKIIGQSVEGRNLYALMFSASRFGRDKSKIKLLVFAQQHGNEQSGKEGALLLAMELIKPENRYLFDSIDFVLVPQVNPDGSAVNKRRNANDADLNRNHLVLNQPETIALHELFDKYHFEVTMDVHEYSPYGDAWKKFGYRKNSDITVGATTNLDISEKIRKLSDESYLPFILKYLRERQFSSFEYCPGGPPEIAYIRHSTFDINDGRQSFGIQNTFSFIQEGMNGQDDFIENLEHRALGQMTGMRGLLEYVYHNKGKIRKMVAEERTALTACLSDQKISVQSEHVRNGEQLKIPLRSYYSGIDSVINVSDYRPVVKSLDDVNKPAGYLVPNQLSEIIHWVERQSLKFSRLRVPDDYIVEQYFVTRVDSIDFEGETIVNPQVVVKEYAGSISSATYTFIPTSQLKGNMIVLALEPKSMLGLITYKDYAHLLKNHGSFPILRVIKK